MYGISRGDLLTALADYFGVEEPNNIYRDYDWNAGCSMGSGRPWLTLANVVEALEQADLIDEED